MVSSRPFDRNSRRTSIASSLPNEIWNYISRFLPNDQLCELYSVNRAFFRIALSLRYREVSLSGLGGNANASKFTRVLEDPPLGKHARVLTLNLTKYGPTKMAGLPVPEEGSLQSKAPVPIVAQRCALLRFMQTFKLKARMRKTKSFITSLDHLTTLVIQCHERRVMDLGYDMYSTILLLGWSTFGSKVRTLSLHMFIETFQDFFSTNIYLPQLDALTLELYTHRDTNKSYPAHPSPKPITNFIRRHHETLRSLRIISLSSLDRQSFYVGIGKLPNLCVFSAEEINQYQGLSPLTSFLALNSETITEFSWSLKLSPEWGAARSHTHQSETPFDIDLFRLRKLTLNFTTLQHHAKDIKRITGFLDRHTDLLTSLSLPGERFFEPELRILLDTIQVAQLCTLEISLYHIRTTTFPALATSLPYLETLTIIYENFGMDVLNYPVLDSSTALTDYLDKFTISDLFVNKMEQTILRRWGLHTLSLRRRSYLWDSSLEYVVGEVIVESMPHLKSINGMERRDFLSLISRRNSVANVRRCTTRV